MVKLPQISRYKQCKDTIEGQAINKLLGLFQMITELKISKLSKNCGMDYEN
jgi:hypothetical protein